MNTVFQNYALFPHMNVLDKVAVGLRMQKVSKSEARARAAEAIGLVQLAGLENRKPSQMSGGQQQRVAIARALALDPEVMLFDEPTSALDPERVKEVLDAMRQLAKGGMTMVVVTHELGFAREVADWVMFMDRGQVVEISDPETFFSNAREERSRRFLNQMQH